MYIHSSLFSDLTFPEPICVAHLEGSCCSCLPIDIWVSFIAPDIRFLLPFCCIFPWKIRKKLNILLIHSCACSLYIYIYSKTLTSNVKRAAILWKKGNHKQQPGKSHAPIQNNQHSKRSLLLKMVLVIYYKCHDAHLSISDNMLEDLRHPLISRNWC